MTPYNKPHLTYQQQLELLKNRGLIVKDEKFAIIKLQHISYYRLSAYFLPFQSTAVMAHYVLNAINDTFEYKTQLANLLDKYPQADRKAMGFVDGWEELEVWR